MLDAGCGQGFFTSLLADLGYSVLGVDLSESGIAAASTTYASTRARFLVGDVLALQEQEQFDCVFTRSCSLFNRVDFADDPSASAALLRYVRPGGVLIFDYYSRLRRPSRESGWRYHSVADVERHFSRLGTAEIFFSLRFDASLLGSHAFTASWSRIAQFGSVLLGLGGELVAIVRTNS